jgi:hypothetical protein
MEQESSNRDASMVFYKFAKFCRGEFADRTASELSRFKIKGEQSVVTKTDEHTNVTLFSSGWTICKLLLRTLDASL